MDGKSFVMIVAQISLIALIASVGLHARWHEVLRTMRNSRLILRAVIAVNVVVPATAIISCGLLPIPQPVKIGIVIMAVSPLAPVLSARLMKAGIDASFAAGLDVALVLLSVVLVPATVGLLSLLFPASASVSVLAVAKLAIFSVLAPLAFGMLLRPLLGAFASRLAKFLTVGGFIGIGLVVVAVLYSRGRDSLELIGNGTVLAIVLTAASGAIAGHSLAGPDRSARLATALAATLRHPGLAALIARQNFASQNVELTIILYVLIAAVFSLVYQAWMTKRASAATTLPATDVSALTQ